MVHIRDLGILGNRDSADRRTRRTYNFWLDGAISPAISSAVAFVSPASAPIVPQEGEREDREEQEGTYADGYAGNFGQRRVA